MSGVCSSFPLNLGVKAMHPATAVFLSEILSLVPLGSVFKCGSSDALTKTSIVSACQFG